LEPVISKLDRRGSKVIDGEAWAYLAEEDGLELEHPCDGE